MAEQCVKLQHAIITAKQKSLYGLRQTPCRAYCKQQAQHPEHIVHSAPGDGELGAREAQGAAQVHAIGLEPQRKQLERAQAQPNRLQISVHAPHVRR